jgi:hypothetical protein
MDNEESLVSRLDHLVQEAKTKVRLYRQLYDGVDSIGSVDDFAQLPTLSKTTLLAGGLEKTLAEPAQLCITRTFEDGPPAADYMPKLLSYDDALGEYKLLSFFIEPADLKSDHKILLIADEHHTYPIADIGHQLAYYEWPLAAFVMREQNARELASYINWFEPTIIFLDARQSIDARMMPESVKCIFSFNPKDDEETSGGHPSSPERFAILRDNWMGSLARKAADEAHYTFEPQFFYFESSGDGALLVTSFIHKLQPVIRYELPYRGSLTGTNTFVLNGSSFR